MSDFTEKLNELMRMYAPAGGFGIPNIGALQGQLQRQSALGARGASAQDLFQLNRMGMGRSVAGAFSPGTRQAQGMNSLLEALINLNMQNAQLSESQRQNLMGMLAPIAEREANRPGWFSTLAGGLLGIGAEAFMPGIAGKLFGNPFEDLFMKAFGGGGGAGTSGYNPDWTRSRLNALPRLNQLPFKPGGW